jgi:hypothetical protein
MRELQQAMARTAAERAEAGEQLVVPSANLQVRHAPRHPHQRDGVVVSMCNQSAVWMLPDAPALRGRVPLPLCPGCQRYSATA